jgi:hypothetical protein
MMKLGTIIIALVTLLLLGGIIWVFSRSNLDPPGKLLIQATPTPAPEGTATSASKPEATPKPQVVPIPALSAAAIPPDKQQQPGGPYQPADPRWEERLRLLKEDPQYEWKTPISFYGKVVDETAQPIPGVEVDLGWTDMSPSGSSTRTLTTDDAGRFALTDEKGKTLVVHSLKKAGYVEANATNRYGFEYAGFWEPTYHEPDPDNPVIFYMRKKGEPAPLVSSEGKLVLTFGTPSPIPMPQPTGAGSPIKITVFESDAKTRKWRAQLSVENGGIVPALEEFPFEAPKEGYQPLVDLNQESPHPPGWHDLDEGGWFYIKTPQGYGLLKLRQIRGKKTLRYQVLLNSKGGTNLEPARP